jgi:hypothetical protein
MGIHQLHAELLAGSSLSAIAYHQHKSKNSRLNFPTQKQCISLGKA